MLLILMRTKQNHNSPPTVSMFHHTSDEMIVTHENKRNYHS